VALALLPKDVSDVMERVLQLYLARYVMAQAFSQKNVFGVRELENIMEKTVRHAMDSAHLRKHAANVTELGNFLAHVTNAVVLVSVPEHAVSAAA